MNLDSILSDEAHDKFHDFRKSLRCVNDEQDEFKTDTVTLFRNVEGMNVTAALGTFNTLYGMYGLSCVLSTIMAITRVLLSNWQGT